MKSQEYFPKYKLFRDRKERLKFLSNSKRVILNSIFFITAVSSIVFCPLMYNRDISVSFDVFKEEQKAYIKYDSPESLEIQNFKRKYIFLSGVVGYTNAGRLTKFRQTDYTYTGSSAWVDDGNDNFRIRFLTSGVFTPSKLVKIDAFIVGGGASGRSSSEYAGGAGSGYTGTYSNITLNGNTGYPIIIAATQTAVNTNGNNSSAFGYTKTGGHICESKVGGSGGSGGGSGGVIGERGIGGSNGGNGAGKYPGLGQGSSTREFGESGGTLYAGAGGGSGGMAGGEGGGGTGYVSSSTPSASMSAMNNTGGGAGAKGSSSSYFGTGGSGIIVIRNHR